MKSKIVVGLISIFLVACGKAEKSSQPPFAPSELSALNDLASFTVKLTWTDNSSYEQGFVVQRKTDNTGWTTIDTVEENINWNYDANISNGMQLSYRVYAFGKSGISDYSPEASILINKSQLNDTTFVEKTIPLAEKHNVLVEEFSGQSCSGSPAAHELLDSIRKSHEEGRINVIRLYSEGITQTKPPAGSKYDLRRKNATQIANEIYQGVTMVPISGVDRVEAVGSRKLVPLSVVWNSTLKSQLEIPSPINLKIESEYNIIDSAANILVSVVYTSKVDYPHNISIAIIEDGIIDKQEYPSTHPVHPGYDTAYNFTDVFRGMITTAPYGDELMPSMPIKEPGRTIIKKFSSKITNVLNPEKCRVIAFINSTNGSDIKIIQSTQTKLK